MSDNKAADPQGPRRPRHDPSYGNEVDGYPLPEEYGAMLDGFS